MRTKRFCLVTHDLSLTGAPLILVEFARHLRNQMAEVSIGTLTPDPHDKVFTRAGFEVEDIADSIFAAENTADVVVANTCVAKYFVRRFLERYPEDASKLVWWIHENDIETYGSGMELMARVGAAIFDSESSRQGWQTSGFELPAVHDVILPGVDDRYFNAGSHYYTGLLGWTRRDRFSYRDHGRKRIRREIRASLGVDHEEFLFLIAGSVTPGKGQDLLRNTWALWRGEEPHIRAKLMIVGFSNETHALEFKANCSALETQSLDPRLLIPETPNLLPYYLAADAFIMNSQQSRGENFGLVTVEAMATGLPVLGTAAGGTKEIVVDGETGLLHPLGREGQKILARNMTRLVTNGAETRRMGKAGYARARTMFRKRDFLRRLDEFFARHLKEIAAQ